MQRTSIKVSYRKEHYGEAFLIDSEFKLLKSIEDCLKLPDPAALERLILEDCASDILNDLLKVAVETESVAFRDIAGIIDILIPV